MASQVLSGSSNPSYTNNTGQNVRIVINFMASARTISWAGVSAGLSSPNTIGRNLAFQTSIEQSSSTTEIVSSTITFPTSIRIGNAVPSPTSSRINIPVSSSVGGALSSNNMGTNALPTELMLAPNQTFSANCGAYNIVVIPEAG